MKSMQVNKRSVKNDSSSQVKESDSTAVCNDDGLDVASTNGTNHKDGSLCQCELCQARVFVSMKNSVEEEFYHFIHQQSHMGDGFHLPINGTSCPQAYHMPYASPLFPGHFQYAYLGEIPQTPCSAFGQCQCHNTHDGLMSDDAFLMNHISHRMPNSPNSDPDLIQNGHTTHPIMPQLYASKEGIIHIRLSPYVALELSGSAYRLINYRNNSAIALSDSGEYGFVYHYNCRGVINMHHEKISIAFDKERQILLRRERSSFVKKEHECYRLASRHWTSCKPVIMESFEKDKTPDVLRKMAFQRSMVDETKLRDAVNSAVMHSDVPLTIYIGDAKVEQRVNGDFQLSWFHEDRANCMIVSPLAGTFSLSTKNLEMITTAKSDIYISFLEFFVHVGSQQLTVSKGSMFSLYDIENGLSSILSLNSTPSDSNKQTPPYSQDQDPKNYDKDVSDVDLLSDSET